MTKKCNTLNADIIDSTIVYEKSRIDENEEMQQFRKIEEQKAALYKELEISEQKEMTAKFELSEMQRLHSEMTHELESMRTKNSDMVNPMIDSLKQQVRLFDDDKF